MFVFQKFTYIETSTLGLHGTDMVVSLLMSARFIKPKKHTHLSLHKSAQEVSVVLQE